MGGVNNFMRYTEQDNSFKFESFYDYVRGAIIFTLVAPLRLIKEVSTKAIYLSKDKLKKILLTACIIEFCIMLLQIVINVTFLQNEFSLLTGKVPIVVHLVSILILLVLTVWYNTCDFIIYKQLEKFLPIVTGITIDNVANDEVMSGNEDVADSEEKVQEGLHFENFEDLDKILTEQVEQKLNDVTKTAPETNPDDLLSGLDDDFLNSLESVTIEAPSYDVPGEQTAFVNSDIYENEDIFQFQNELDREVINTVESDIVYSGNLNSEEKQTIKDNMENARDPSKYISEDNLKIFFNKLGVDNFGTIDDLSNWVTPKEFSLVS